MGETPRPQENKIVEAAVKALDNGGNPNKFETTNAEDQDLSLEEIKNPQKHPWIYKRTY